MNNFSMNEHLWFMNLALEQAEIAYRKAEIPIGAVLVSKDKSLIAASHNEKEHEHNPCAHAEILALQKSANLLKNWRLTDCILYVTLEPCPMCLSAMSQARISQCIFGAYDAKGGALSLGFDFYKDKRLNHQFNIMGGIKHYPCAKILSTFFRERRREYKNKP